MTPGPVLGNARLLGTAGQMTNTRVREHSGNPSDRRGMSTAGRDAVSFDRDHGFPKSSGRLKRAMRAREHRRPLFQSLVSQALVTLGHRRLSSMSPGTPLLAHHSAIIAMNDEGQPRLSNRFSVASSTGKTGGLPRLECLAVSKHCVRRGSMFEESL